MVLSLLQCCHTDGHHLSLTHSTELASVLSHWWPSSVTDSRCWACFSAVTLMVIICHWLTVLSLLQCCHTDGHHLSQTHGAELASVLSHWWPSSVTDSRCWACFSAVTLMAIICHWLMVLSLLQCCHTDGHHLSCKNNPWHLSLDDVLFRNKLKKNPGKTRFTGKSPLKQT